MNGKNAAFEANPLQFVNGHAINVVRPVADLQVGAISEIMNFDLVPNAGGTVDEVRLAMVPPGSQAHETPIRAYYVEYTSVSLQGTNPKYRDVPKKNPPARFVFTGQLSGCSLIVTNLDANQYRVYHDARVNSSKLHANVVAKFDFSDYELAGQNTGLAATLMFYDRDRWVLVGQGQQYGPGHMNNPHGSVAIRPLSSSTKVFVSPA
ncbi:MAG: hypothetical protein AB7I48_05205 [Planctomycetaceae bacterium]